MSESIKIGIAYPQSELAGDPEAFRQFGKEVERLGFTHLVMFDHPVNAVHGIKRDIPLPVRAYSEHDPFHDPFVAFAHLAALTDRIELITGVLVLPQRQTALVARQAADLALLSGGRLRLGVGVGYNPVEYQALGQDFRTRGRRLDEQIPFLRRLWTGQPQNFAGRFDTIVEAAVVPAPAAPIPIWIGGGSDAAFQRAARDGDGFIFGYGFGDEALEAWQRVQSLLVEAGRDVGGFRSVFSLLPEDPGSRSAQDVVDAVLRVRDARGTDATITTARHGLQGLGEHLEFLAEMRGRLDEVMA